MKVRFLDNLTGKWAKQWVITWFIVSTVILSFAFWKTTNHSNWDCFYLGVSIIGLLCVVSLSFRKNLAGNGLGIIANIGEIITQRNHGATGLLLAPIFYLLTHTFGMKYWAKNTDINGNMVPATANKKVWFLAVGFILFGLILFPFVNSKISQYQFIDNSDPSFYIINIIAFVLGVTAQTCMILRYSFSWWLWIIVNFVWLIVNIKSGNMIFATQNIIYQVNSFIGLYEWHFSENK